MVLAGGAQAAAADVYIAQSAAGTADGSSCANAKAVSFFNTASNWGAGAGQIGPGKTVHLCGTITTPLATQGSGASGNPVTILFENNSLLSAPYWGATGALACANDHFITIDGGANGQIVATANGTARANQQASVGILTTGCNSLEVRNLTIANMYARTPNSSDGTSGSQGIAIFGGNDVLVHDNTIHDAQYGIIFAFGAGTSNNQAYRNTISHTATGIVYGSQNTSASASNVLLHDNEIYDAYFWDSPGNLFHCDGIHIWEYGPSLTGLQIYNNYIHGNNGRHITGWVFLEGNVPNALLYNNVLEADTGSSPTDGFICIKEPTNAGIYNNTINGNGAGSGFASAGSGGHTFKNNVIINVSHGIYTPTGDNTITTDYNLFFGVSYWGVFESWAQWQGKGQDANGKNGSDPKLDSSYKPQSGSAAIGAGTNLTSLNIPALNADKAGVIRPLIGPWDAGAYQYLSGGGGDTTPPSVPRNLRIR
jgi:hypothetical protein